MGVGELKDGAGPAQARALFKAMLQDLVPKNGKMDQAWGGPGSAAGRLLGLALGRIPRRSIARHGGNLLGNSDNCIINSYYQKPEASAAAHHPDSTRGNCRRTGAPRSCASAGMI